MCCNSGSAATEMLVWGILSVVPTIVLLFLNFYGDPGPGCTPV